MVMVILFYFFSAKEKADVDNMQQPSVRDFFKDQSQFDAQMSKEQVRKNTCIWNRL